MTISREDLRFWDTRTLDRRMRKGQVAKKDFEKYLKTLPDAADKAAPLDTDDDDGADGASGEE